MPEQGASTAVAYAGEDACEFLIALDYGLGEIKEADGHA